uniref:Uncharacterized LOC108249225 n=1 Tax=Kryptolebias marmoratus TaxID=37003 RepID=A0A3Q3AFZ8_KRYMA
MSSGHTGGMSSSWGGDRSLSGNKLGQNTLRSRVVVVKYDRRPLSDKTLFAFTEMFGSLREHLILDKKAFLEMESHEEALDVVNYYKRNPTTLYGKPVTFYLSQSLMVIEKKSWQADRPVDRSARDIRGYGSKVVFFSHLPREDEEKMELLTVAERFGVVEKYLFSKDEAFIQMGTVDDAEMLVKYYSENSLTIGGQLVHLNICAKYKTLNVEHRQEGRGAQYRSSRSEMTSSSRMTSKSSSRSREEEEEEKEKEEQQEEEEKEEQEEQQEEEQQEEKEEEEQQEEEQQQEQQQQEEEQQEEQQEEKEMDQDFLENMEDFVTLDELEEDEGDAHKDSSAEEEIKKGGLRVVSIMGFRRGYNFLHELLALAKPFGKVEKHLVLDRRAEAFIQFKKDKQARAMHKFYSNNVTATVGGCPVRIQQYGCHSIIQSGSSRVVHIAHIPNIKYSEDDILELVEPFGNIQKYSLNRFRKECLIEMENTEDAEKLGKACQEKSLTFGGKRLAIYVSNKYPELPDGQLYLSKKRANSSSPPKSTQPSEEPPAKKLKEAEPQEEEEERTEQTSAEKPPEVSEEKKISEDAAAEVKVQQANQEPAEEAVNTSSNQNGQTEALPPADIKPSVASLPLPPHNPDTPIGVEHVKMGYYCRICFLFYSNKDTAMKNHCSSWAHYDKLQKHLEKEQTKAAKKKVKTAA